MKIDMNKMRGIVVVGLLSLGLVGCSAVEASESVEPEVVEPTTSMDDAMVEFMEADRREVDRKLERLEEIKRELRSGK